MTKTIEAIPRPAGFMLIGPAKSVLSMPAAAVSIAKGDLLKDDTNGYVTNASITTFDDTGLMHYVAIEPCDNSAGSSGDLNVLCVSCNDSTNEYWVPVEDGTVIARGDVGTIVDCQTEDGIDVDNAAAKDLGFLIEGFDASTAAVAINTYGYARGRFVIPGETT